MAVDFFERQETARRNTGWLVFLFILAVLAIMVMVYVVVIFIIGMMTGRHHPMGASSALYYQPNLMFIVMFAVVSVVLGGCLYKIAQLRTGGSYIAEYLGGRLIRPDTTDVTERKVLNVVEEMAIASGMPVPPVYLLDQERGINAFAAGFTNKDAVISVTRGCAELLSRDELQGVIGHEFSHILNGDMRLNIHLIGILNGILVIGIIGYYILRTVGRSTTYRSSRDKGGSPLILLGLALLVIGYVGVFFGNLIKAAVSRQREFLADASSVQFTRHPDGIAGALKKIGGLSLHSRIEHPNAHEVSHMFFSQAVTSFFGGLFATHPPLPERIRRIDSSWDGQYIQVQAPVEPPSKIAVSRAASMGFVGSPAATAAVAANPAKEHLLRHIGRPTKVHVDYVNQLTQGLPLAILQAARETYGARALIYALLMDKDAEMRRLQWAQLEQHADSGTVAETKKLVPLVEPLDARITLILIDMTIPALCALSPSQYEDFKQMVRKLIDADKKIDLFEWMLQRTLLQNVEAQIFTAKPPSCRYYGLNQLQSPCGILFSTLAYAGHHEPAAAQKAFQSAMLHLNMPAASLLPTDQCGLKALDEALEVLNQVAFRLKRQLLEACVICIWEDKQITSSEIELLRAISASLGCPMPPILPGESLE